LAASRLTEDVMPPDILKRSKPEYVVPMVLYLVSDDCEATGQIFNAGMGYYNRAAVVTGKGFHLSPDGEAPGPEQILENWDAIDTLDPGKEASSLTEALMEMMR
jgi:hypothetical protein